MSWQIPTQIEQDIIAGKATYRTFQTGNGGQSILPVPANAYAVIFGYDFSPAGGGLVFQERSNNVGDGQFIVGNSTAQWFQTQQISFYTGTDFYPFIHHVDLEQSAVAKIWDASIPDDNFIKEILRLYSIDNTPISRQVYITSANDVTITHGLVRLAPTASSNNIPVTSRTPPGLTYGGSAIVNATQTDYGPALSPLQFMQPSPKDYQDFGFGLLPNNADGQAFATPDTARGLRSVTELEIALGISGQASNQYYLNLHYALYSKTIPETRG
jgi:hypothetical protein